MIKTLLVLFTLIVLAPARAQGLLITQPNNFEECQVLYRNLTQAYEDLSKRSFDAYVEGMMQLSRSDARPFFELSESLSAEAAGVLATRSSLQCHRLRTPAEDGGSGLVASLAVDLGAAYAEGTLGYLKGEVIRYAAERTGLDSLLPWRTRFLYATRTFEQVRSASSDASTRLDIVLGYVGVVAGEYGVHSLRRALHEASAARAINVALSRQLDREMAEFDRARGETGLEADESTEAALPVEGAGAAADEVPVDDEFERQGGGWP